MYVAIAGNIGSGKTELIHLLQQELGWEVSDDNMSDNPYLSNFYADMSRWALNLQIYFLTRRFKAVQRAMWSDKVILQDRTMYEDANVFVENLLNMRLMSYAAYKTYRELYDTMTSYVKPPELLIYLKASPATLINNIRRRNNPGETAINFEYLTMLNNRYNDWIDEYKENKVEIDIDNTDIIHDKECHDKVIKIITNHLPYLSVTEKYKTT